jgi:hypothetical protein
MNWTAVTFYTTGTGYEQEVKKLLASAGALGLPVVAYAYPSMGSWRANLNYKSECILQAMEGFPGQDIVFVDADAIIRSWPGMFDDLSRVRDHDLAAHYFQWRATSPLELLTGTLWVANTERGRAVVAEWDKMARAHPETRHQRCLQVVVENMVGIRVAMLPVEYTCIYDAPARRGKVAVIEHFQASRKYRRQVGAPQYVRPIGPLTSAGLRVAR